MTASADAGKKLKEWLDAHRDRFPTDQSAADHLIISGPRLSQILSGDRASRDLAIRIHVMTSGLVPGSLMRPDFWAKPDHVPMPEAAE